MADEKVAQVEPKKLDEKSKIKEEVRAQMEQRMYRVLAQVTPHIATKFLEAGATRLTTEEITDLAEANEDIQLDSAGHLSVLALIQSLVWVATGKKLKGLRHPTSGEFGGFQLVAPTVLVHKPKTEK